MKSQFIWLVSFITIQIFAANTFANNEFKPGIVWGGAKKAAPGPNPGEGDKAKTESSSWGMNVSDTEVKDSGYQEKSLGDFSSSAGKAAGAAENANAEGANSKIVLAEQNAILNKARCESFSKLTTGASQVAASVAQQASDNCVELRSSVKSCDSIFTGTMGVSNLCHTEKNESIASTVTMIQAIMGAAGSIVDSCNDFGKAMNLAQKGMTAYTLACGTAQVACKVKCGSAKTAVDQFKANAEKVLGQMDGECTDEANLPQNIQNGKTQSILSHCKAVLNAINKFNTMDIAQDNQAPFGVRAKAEICVVNVPSLLMSGVVGIASFANAKAKSDQCKADAEAKKAAETAQNSCQNVANKDRADCACTLQQNKTLSYCATGLVDCGLSENADKPLCICKANPRMKGCEGVSTSLATNSALNSGNSGGLSSTRSPGSLNNAPAAATDAAGIFPKNKSGNGNDGSGSGTSSGGGSSAGLSADGGGGSNATDKAASKDGAAKDAANILDSSGGGGGGFRSSGFGSYSSPDYRNKLKAFANMNGIGAKIAGSGWTDQVTTTGGKSNFEKIKTRYQENKPTLLGK